MIALIDYKAGNLTSVKKALASLGAHVFVPDAPGDLARAAGIIVPGVGHFGATRVLDRAWMNQIVDHVTRGQPLLGICLGMQWLFESSEEASDVPGLGLLGGTCVKLAANGLKVPHVGWNSLSLQRQSWITDGLCDEPQVYFTHSFVAPVTGDTVAVTEHGEGFASIVQRGQIAGVQFHPEKSGSAGLRILKNFIDLSRRI